MEVDVTALQPDGKMIIGGFFSKLGGTAKAHLARLHADGSVDASFTANTNGLVYSTAVQVDGVMIDYVTLPEMNGLFDANWDGQPLETPRTLMMGFHPATPGFSEGEYLRVDGFLKYADLRLGTRHLGPVVYITLADVVAAYAP